jgi:hypothetical protein
MALPGSSAEPLPALAPHAVALAAELAERSGILKVYPSSRKGVKGQTPPTQSRRDL